MRPLAIWAMQWSLERHALLNTPSENRALSLLIPRPPSALPSDKFHKDALAVVFGAEEDGCSEGYGSDEKEGYCKDGRVAQKKPEEASLDSGIAGANGK